jgi:tetratricopeptide repeat protein
MSDYNYKSFAFISYSHRDMKVAKWLQRWLEGFKLPTEIYNEIDAKSRYLRPVFRDESDLDTGILGDELRKHLEESKYLILICSKNSAESKWVSDEAKAFVEMGRLDRIIPLVLSDGTVPERELFPIYLRELFVKEPLKELLGINLHETGKEKALIRIVSRMIDVSFDELWKRHERERRRRIVVSSIFSAVIMFLVYLFAVPISLIVHVSSERCKLPEPEMLTVRINNAEYVAEKVDTVLSSIRLPGYYRVKSIHIAANVKYYKEIDTLWQPCIGTNANLFLSLKRDSTFAVFAGKVLDDNLTPLEEVTVKVAGYEDVTDAYGRFEIVLPIEQQKEEQKISLTKEGFIPVQLEDETPGKSLVYVLHHK